MRIARKIQMLLVMISCVVAFAGIARAENASETGKHNHLKKRLTDKYKKISEVSSTLQETPNGPLGHLSIGGQMAPNEVPVVEGEHAWERGMAKGFLKQEAAMLGISNIDEMQERLVKSSTGYYGETTHVYYHRVINGLILEGTEIHIAVDNTRKISSVMAELVPTPPELYEATKRKTISEQDVINIITQEVKSKKKKAKNIFTDAIGKRAVSYKPYVIWKAKAALDYREGDAGEWEYWIDAFSGEIIKERSLIINK